MKTAILLAGYGSANPESRHGLRGFENLCRARFPDFPIRLAFTSVQAVSRMASLGQKGDSLAKALARLKYERHEAVAIQPLQSIPGSEYEQVWACVEQSAKATGMKCALGAPILRNAQDLDRAAMALAMHLPQELHENDEILFMAHGARHAAGVLYERLAQRINSQFPFMHLAAMSGHPTLEDTLPKIRSSRVWLMPLLSVIGSHALRDMAGGGPDSWKSRLEAAGKICHPVFLGMTQTEGFAKIWLDNLAQAVSNLENTASEKMLFIPPAPPSQILFG